jgi:tetratricopeptide (TPR) repeat protein
VAFRASPSYFAKRDYEHLIADDSEAMPIDPTDHRSYYSRPIMHLTIQDHDHAIADRATSLNPNDANALMRRGNSDDVKRDYDRAVTDLSAVLKPPSDDASVFYARAQGYAAEKDYQHAIHDHTNVINRDTLNMAA